VIPRRGKHLVRVLYQDTDQAKVVHHASYFRYLEAARIELWREQGFSYDAFEKETGLGLPVAEAQMRYRSAARFDDLLEVETWADVATRASVWFAATVKRGDVVLVESRVRLACASFADGQVRRIPQVLLDACLEPGHGV
jgi:acyl-CoA thioester hydrolase